VGPLAIVGWSAVGVLVVLWLAVSFSAPGPRRAPLEWLGASALYVALSSLFLSLVLRARAADNTFALVAFGFLLLIFAGGLVVSLVNTVRAFGGPSDSKSQAAATN
jgi:hypothetical protein